MAKEGLRRSTRTPALKDIPHRHKELFHAEKPALGKKLELIHKNPNVYLVRNFLNESEIALMDKICTFKKGKFNSSFVENDDNEEVVSEMRTSKYVYVNKAHSTEIRAIEERAATLSGLDVSGVEPLQIVSYTQGQKFETHHDAEGQGHTEFPALGLSVKPERGCGVLFSNVRSDGSVDPRTQHRAAPVSGSLEKFGINVWITDANFQDLALAGVKGAVTTKELRDFYSKNEIIDVTWEKKEEADDNSKKKGFMESALRYADRMTREYDMQGKRSALEGHDSAKKRKL